MRLGNPRPEIEVTAGAVPTLEYWRFFDQLARGLTGLDSAISQAELDAALALYVTSSSLAAQLAALTDTVPYQLACSDLTTALTAATSVGYFRSTAAATITGVRASLLTASSSGVVTVDINKNGSTILSTKLTIDANEKTSVTAATAAVLTSTVLANDDEITIDIDNAGTGAAGLIVSILTEQ